MLATSNFPSSSPHAFLPVIPSPLSPRRATHGHYQPRLFSDFMTSQQPSDTRRSQQTPFSARPIKPVPTTQRPDALRERRRDIFLKKIKQTRDDSRWESRTEDVCLSSLQSHQYACTDFRTDGASRLCKPEATLGGRTSPTSATHLRRHSG